LTAVLVAGFLAAAVYLSLDLSPEAVLNVFGHPGVKRFKERLLKLYRIIVPGRTSLTADPVDEVIKRHPEWDRRLLMELIENTGSLDEPRGN